MRVVTGSADSTARVWTTVIAHRHALRGHTKDVWSAEASRDNTQIVTASADNTVRVWDMTSGRQLVRLEHPDAVVDASFRHDGAQVVTTSVDENVRVWNLPKGDLATTIEVEREPEQTRWTVGDELSDGPDDKSIWIRSARFEATGKRILTFGLRRFSVYGARTGELKARIRGSHFATARDDSQQIVTAALEGKAALWELGGKQPLTSFEGHRERLRAVAFSPDHKRIVTASDDHTARIWDTSNGRETVKLSHDEGVTYAVFSPDGNKIATTSNDRSARLWDAQTGKPLMVFPHADQVRHAVFGPDGTFLATTAADDKTRLWHTKTGALLETIAGTKASFTRDGTRLLVVRGEIAWLLTIRFESRPRGAIEAVVSAKAGWELVEGRLLPKRN
jgi:WD40 repeat protein